MGIGKKCQQRKNQCILAYNMFQKIVSFPKEALKFEQQLSMIYYIALKVLLYIIGVDTSIIDTDSVILFQ